MKQRWFYIGIIITVVVILVIIFAIQNSNQNNLQVVFFDVGQGDSHFIRTPGGQNILIDGGPDKTVLEKLTKYMPLQDKTIDLMILTHPHSDHVTGLVEVLKRYQVKRILATGVMHTTDVYLEWLDLIKEKEITFDKAIAPKQYIFETSEEPVILSVLYPDRDVSGEDFDDLNDSSVVVMLNYKDKKFLFTGDISADIEKRIINRSCQKNLEKTVLPSVKSRNDACEALKSNILKVAHQGSDTSTSEELLTAVKPQYAIIPVGENKFGHPSLRIIRRLERVGAKIFRTDKNGDIMFIINRNGNLKILKKSQETKN